ncbi:MAG TPA: bluetail domain-containing putative surface protein [Elainellaceae cyanobacterium]
MTYLGNLNDNTLNTGGTVGPGNFFDEITFNNVHRGNVRITLPAVGGFGNTDLELYDSRGQLVGQSSNYNWTNPGEQIETFLEAGTYTVRVIERNFSVRLPSGYTVWIQDLTPTGTEPPLSSPAPVIGSSRGEHHRGTTNDDFIDARGGNDTIAGFGGNDTLFGDSGNDVVRGGAGNDLLFGEHDYRYRPGLNPHFGDDTLYGGDGDDYIDGGQGNDTIWGGENNDTVNGRSENDLIYGEGGHDTIFGEDGNDWLFGEEDYNVTGVPNPHFGNDLILGGNGDDYIDGGRGNDTLWGGAQNDTINGRAENDAIYGEGGHDTIFGEDGEDTIYGQDGNDLIWGGNGRDTIAGGSGNDLLIGGDGVDTLTGGEGNDTFGGFGRNTYDTITDFQIGTDVIDGPTSLTAAQVAQLRDVSAVNIDAIQEVLTPENLAVHGAATFGFSNRTFVALNDGIAGFQQGDILLEISGYSGDLSSLSIA